MLLGFYEIQAFRSNALNSYNPIGELGDLAHTYSRTIREYESPLGLLSIFDIGGLTNTQQLALAATCANVVTLLDGIPNYVDTSATLLVDITNALGNTVSLVTIGDAILNPVNNKLYPKWVQFTVTVGGQPWEFKIWLNNADFVANYPSGEFTLIYPITNLQQLYTNFVGAKAIIDALDPTSMTQIAHNTVTWATTGVDSFKIRVFSATDNTQYFDFPVLVAYNGGTLYNNQNAYFQAFKTAILNSGLQTLDQWLTVIPGLVPLLVYYVIPNWANAAISNGALPYPIESPTIPLIDGAAFAASYFPDYTVPQVTDYLNYSVAMYKSVGFFAVPDRENLGGVKSFKTEFSDYFLVSLSDVNSGQMTLQTQQMATVLDTLLRAAESYMNGDPISPSISILHRGNDIYLCTIFSNIKLCVMTRYTALNP